MKKIILSFALMLFVSMGVFAQGLAMNEATSKEEKAPKPSFFKWEKSTHDFGTIDKGVAVSAVFEFTNSESAPISINKVTTTCGCTVTDYTKSSIGPGEYGYIKATYNAATEGAFNKKVVILTSEGEHKNLMLKGIVK